MKNIIDFRSDTITIPESEVLNNISRANIGDDVYGEDNETIKLQDYTASLFKKEASLFVPTGTMANLIALMIYSQDGGEVIMDRNSHPIHYESGGMAKISGLSHSLAQDKDGIIIPISIRHLIREDIYYMPKTALIWLENTHNRGGGTVYPINTLKEIYNISREYNIPLHIDGARFLNACAYLNEDPHILARYCDSLSICLSKGLCSPLGSILLGDNDFIIKARRYRKMLGGGMRQIGYISYIAYHYLRKYKEMFKIDHENAGILNNALSIISNATSIWGGTNIVLFKFFIQEQKKAFEDYLMNKGIFMSSLTHDSLRFVTSSAQKKEDIQYAVNTIKEFKERYHD